jgi:hypothetical protein
MQWIFFRSGTILDICQVQVFSMQWCSKTSPEIDTAVLPPSPLSEYHIHMIYDVRAPYLRCYSSDTDTFICILCGRRDCFNLPVTERAILHKSRLAKILVAQERRVQEAREKMEKSELGANQFKIMEDSLELYTRTLRQIERSYDLLTVGDLKETPKLSQPTNSFPSNLQGTS